MEESYEEKMLDYYLSIGAIEIAGIDDNGEIIYLVTEKAKDIAPELWESHINYVDDVMMELYKKDLVTVSYDENLEATFSLNKEAIEEAEKLGLIKMNFEDE